MTSIVLIPAYKPDQRLVSLVKDLCKFKSLNLLIINNGNQSEYLNYFESISRFNKVSVLNIKKNQGKGFGNIVINYIINQANNKPVKLSVLKGNPAKKLYESLGFIVINENEQEWFMQT